MLEIDIEADEEWDSSTHWSLLVRRAAEAALAESAFPQLSQSERPVELSVRLTGDEEVANATVAGPELLLGDIVLAHGVCEREAAEKDIPVERHAAHLLVHGTLHLLGYDHHEEDQAVDMEHREVRALARLGIGDPYGDRS